MYKVCIGEDVMIFNLEYRQTTRGAVCSCCDKGIVKNQEYSNCFHGHRSKQGTIFICDDCVKIMNKNIMEKI